MNRRKFLRFTAVGFAAALAPVAMSAPDEVKMHPILTPDQMDEFNQFIEAMKRSIASAVGIPIDELEMDIGCNVYSTFCDEFECTTSAVWIDPRMMT